jgi:hypothetical protein
MLGKTFSRTFKNQAIVSSKGGLRKNSLSQVLCEWKGNKLEKYTVYESSDKDLSQNMYICWVKPFKTFKNQATVSFNGGFEE